MRDVIKMSIQHFVEAKFGTEAWRKVKAAAGCSEPFIADFEEFGAELSADLLDGLAEVSGMPREELLVEYGKFWVLNTCRDGHAAYCSIASASPRDFVLHMNLLYKHTAWDAPAAGAPRLDFEELPDGRLLVHLQSSDGFCAILRGQILGAGALFGQELEVRETACRERGDSRCTVEVIFP